MTTIILDGLYELEEIKQHIEKVVNDYFETHNIFLNRYKDTSEKNQLIVENKINYLSSLEKRMEAIEKMIQQHAIGVQNVFIEFSKLSKKLDFVGLDDKLLKKIKKLQELLSKK